MSLPFQLEIIGTQEAMLDQRVGVIGRVRKLALGVADVWMVEKTGAAA